MKTKTTINGGTLTIERPATPAQSKAALASIATRDANDAKQATDEKDKAKGAKAAFTKSKQGKVKAKRTAEEIATDKAAKESARAEKTKATALAKLGDAKSDEAKHAANHSRADSEAEGGAVKAAVTARKLFSERVLKVKDGDAYTLLRVSGRGVTLPRFKDGIRVLGYHKGFPVDADGKMSEPHFDACRAVYNKANEALNALLAKVDAAKSTKYTVSASPKPKKGKGERNATIAKRTKVNMAILLKAGAMALDGWNALLSVCDSSARILDSGASLLVCDAKAFAKAGEGAIAKFGRHLGNMRASAACKRPEYTNEKTLAMVDRKDGTVYLYKSFDLFPKFMEDAQAFNVKTATKVKVA